MDRWPARNVLEMQYEHYKASSLLRLHQIARGNLSAVMNPRARMARLLTGSSRRAHVLANKSATRERIWKCLIQFGAARSWWRPPDRTVLAATHHCAAFVALRRHRKSAVLVGVAGFEPATPSSRTRCATRLRYTPAQARCYNRVTRALQALALQHWHSMTGTQ